MTYGADCRGAWVLGSACGKCQRCIDTAPAAFAAFRRDLASQRPDAMRYRWLRDRDVDTIDKGGIFAGMTPKNVVLNGAELDAAIDAAMAEEKRQ